MTGLGDSISDRTGLDWDRSSDMIGNNLGQDGNRTGDRTSERTSDRTSRSQREV